MLELACYVSAGLNTALFLYGIYRIISGRLKNRHLFYAITHP